MGEVTQLFFLMIESSRKLPFERCELKDKCCEKPINKGDLRSVQICSA
jgi:hypothetical protein